MFYLISSNYVKLPYKRVVLQFPSRGLFEFQNFKNSSVFECEWGSYRFETILLYSPSRSLWTAPQRKGNVIQQHYKCTCNILYILINIPVVLLSNGCSIDFNFKICLWIFIVSKNNCLFNFSGLSKFICKYSSVKKLAKCVEFFCTRRCNKFCILQLF